MKLIPFDSLQFLSLQTTYIMLISGYKYKFYSQ